LKWKAQEMLAVKDMSECSEELYAGSNNLNRPLIWCMNYFRKGSEPLS